MLYSKMAIDEMVRAVLRKYGHKVSYRDESFLVLGFESEKMVCNFDNGLRIDERDGVFYRDELMFSWRKRIYCIGEWVEKLKWMYKKVVESDNAHNVASRWIKYGIGDYHKDGLSVTFIGRLKNNMLAQEERDDGTVRTIVDTRAGICRPSEGLNKMLRIIEERREVFRRKKYPEYFAQSGKGNYFTSDIIEKMAWNAVNVLGDNEFETSYTYVGADAMTIKSRNVRQKGLFVSFSEGKEEGDLNILFNGKTVFSSQFAYDMTGGKENPNKYSSTSFEADRMIFASVFVGGEWEKNLEELNRKANRTIEATKIAEENKRKLRAKEFSGDCLRYLGAGFGNYTIVDKSCGGVIEIEIYETCTKKTQAFRVPTRRFLFRTGDPFFYEDAVWHIDFMNEIKRRRGY